MRQLKSHETPSTIIIIIIMLTSPQARRKQSRQDQICGTPIFRPLKKHHHGINIIFPKVYWVGVEVEELAA